MKKKIATIILTFNSEAIIKRTILAAKKISKNVFLNSDDIEYYILSEILSMPEIFISVTIYPNSSAQSFVD